MIPPAPHQPSSTATFTQAYAHDLRKSGQGLGLVSQYNPHGLFIALENVGYLLAVVALGCAGAAMAATSRLLQAARVIMVLGATVAVVALVGLAIAYGTDLEYRFEVVGTVVDWLVLIVTGVLVSIDARRATGRAAG